MSNLKRFFASLTIASTILMTGAGAILPVTAVTIADGDLVKSADSSAVYLIQGAKKRVIPHLNVYLSWGYPSNFSTVKTVSAADLALYADDNAVPFRDGAMFRGTAQSLGGKDASAVFYVEDAQLRAIKSAEIYQALFNDANWTKVTWVPDDLLTKFNYPMGTTIESSATHPDGCLIKYTGTTQVYLIQDGKKRAVSAAAMTANQLNAANVITIAATETYTDGTAITGAESAILTPGWATTVGALTIALDPDSPEATNVPKTASNVVYTKVKLTASGPVTINSITVKRAGMGTASNFASIGLFEGSTQLGTYKTLSSDTDTATINVSPALTLTAGQTKYLAIKATSDGTAGVANKLGLTALSTDATVSGLPVYGKEMTVVNVTVGTLTATFQSVSNTSPKVGEDNVELAVVKLAVNSVEDIEVNSFKLQQSGTAGASDLSNLAIYQSGEKKGACSYANDYLTCVFDTPYLIKKDTSKEVKVLGDIESGWNRTVILGLERSEDIQAIGKSYGYGVTVVDAGGDSVAGNILTIKTGTITINFYGPDSGDIVVNQKNINMANFEITSNNEDAELKTLKVSVKINGTATSTASVFTNLELYDPVTGNIYDASADVANTKWDLKPYITLSKGVKRTFQIRLDTPNTTIAGNTTYQVLLADTDLSIKGLTSNQPIAAAEIAPDNLTGKLMALKAAGLTLTGVALTGVTKTAGSKGVVLYKADLVVVGEAIKITKIIVEKAANNQLDKDNLDNLYLYKVVDETETLVKTLTDDKIPDNSATFDGLNLQVEPGKLVTILVKGDISKPADLTNTNLRITVASNAKIDSETVSNGVNVVETVTAADGSLVAIVANGILTIDLNKTETGLAKDLYVLANATTPFIGRIKLTAQYENIKIEDLVLENTANTIARSVKTIELYKSDKTTKLASANWLAGSKTIKFDDLNYVVKGDTTDYLYLKAILNKIGLDAEDTAVSGDIIEMNSTSTNAIFRGEDSGTDITNTSTTMGVTQSLKAQVMAARINSVANGLANGTLQAGSNKIIAKFKIKADTTSNVSSSGDIARVELTNLDIALTTSTKVNAANLKIEREGGLDDKKDFTFTNWTSTFTNDQFIESGQEAIYIIYADVTDTHTAGENAYLETQVAADADLDWKDDGMSAATDLRLYTAPIDGARLELKH